LHEAYARIDGSRLMLINAHIDPYTKSAIVYNHDPRRERQLLVHKRELKKIAAESEVKGTTLIPLAIYFKEGRAKLELGVAKGKQQFDKRATIKKKEQDRELRRQTMSHRV
jgi:SsrA-binding protein